MRSIKETKSELEQSIVPKERLRIFRQIPENILHTSCVIMFRLNQEMDVIHTDVNGYGLKRQCKCPPIVYDGTGISCLSFRFRVDETRLVIDRVVFFRFKFI